MARFPVVVIWLAVPEAVVQGFAALVVVLVVAGVLAVLGLGSRSRRAREPARRPARLPAHTRAYPALLDPAGNGTSRERLRS